MLTGPKRVLPPGLFTRAMNITYLRPLPLPATIRVVSEVVRHGRSMSLVRGRSQIKAGRRFTRFASIIRSVLWVQQGQQAGRVGKVQVVIGLQDKSS